MSALPAALEEIRLALNEAAEAMAALDAENVKLLNEVTRLSQEIVAIKAGLDGAP